MIGAALANVFEALDYRQDEGLLTVESPDVQDGRAYIWQEIRDKLQMDAAYFHGNTPVVYFKELQAVDDEDLWKLHRSLWNHNRAPLLIAVLPQEVRVYNCFAPPVLASGELIPETPVLLKRAVEQVTDILALRGALADYRRREIVSGRFVHAGQRGFNRDERVDSRLLENLGQLRRLLIDDDLSEPVANSLLGRSIFVRYLEDRGVISQEYYSRFASGDSYHALLNGSLNETYQLFDELASRFNGDLFPVDDTERSQVKPHHLQRLGRFLAGEEVISGQMYFWAYDFNYIPIELISAIYETFLDKDRQRTSAYYTPPEVVEFVLNEVLPFPTETRNVKILDPACGSGIFLVEAFRRLVTFQRLTQRKAHLSFDELRDLLTESIHGVDLSEEAVRVAAFSCYLAMLDFLEPKSIWEGVRFPKLVGTNLFVNDFFDTAGQFNDRSYDIIVGNPPWQSKLTAEAAEYMSRQGYPIGDKQIAQAFLWRAPELLTDGGRVCLLAPSKGVLYNTNKPNRDFRRQFFLRNQVTQIVDCSALRHSMFREAVAPMAAVFYRKMLATDNETNHLVYVNPHPSPMSHALAGMVVFGDEVKRFSGSQVVGHPYIWKMALWGTPRDFALVDELCERFPTLEAVTKRRQWQFHAGVIVNGSSAHHAPELGAMRYVPVNSVQQFHVSSPPDQRIGSDVFHRQGDIRTFQGPHVLVRRGVIAHGVLASAFLWGDAVFTNGVFGIAGPAQDSNYMKIVCACINSSLARYYQFLTASQWGVERDEVLLAEHKSFPCAIPLEGTELFLALVNMVDKIQEARGEGEWRAPLDRLVYEAYGVTPSEQRIIEDFLAVDMDRHYNGLTSAAFQVPSTIELTSYAEAFAEVFTRTTGGAKALMPVVYEGSPPYRAVSFRLAQGDVQGGNPAIAAEPELDTLLVRLERTATEQHARSLYFRRNIKVYEGDAIHIVKPAERRFWTNSAAYNDADETIAQLLRTVSRDDSR